MVLHAYFFILSAEYSSLGLIFCLVGVACCFLLCRVCSIYIDYTYVGRGKPKQSEGEDNDIVYIFRVYFFKICYVAAVAAGGIDLISYGFYCIGGRKGILHMKVYDRYIRI